MCWILLGLILDLPLPDGQASTQIIRAVCALLDFTYLAQFPSHTTNTLSQLQDSLACFHNNKSVFIDLGLHENFNIPKFHSMTHYYQSITQFSTTDNYNTEQTEQLHIDFTKDAYCATNQKDEYPQMTTWLERCEKIQQHAAYINWWQHVSLEDRCSLHLLKPLCPETWIIQMTQHPTRRAVSFNNLAYHYGAITFQDALTLFQCWTVVDWKSKSGHALVD